MTATRLPRPRRAVTLLAAGVLLLSAMTAVLHTSSAEALENGVARTPPMGWNSWNVWGGAVDDAKVRAAADEARVEERLPSLGLGDRPPIDLARPEELLIEEDLRPRGDIDLRHRLGQLPVADRIAGRAAAIIAGDAVDALADQSDQERHEHDRSTDGGPRPRSFPLFWAIRWWEELWGQTAGCLMTSDEPLDSITANA